MKAALLILALGGMASCRANERTVKEEIVMQQDPILKLVNDNDIAGVKKALENGVSVHTQDENQRNLLLIATNKGLVEMATLLVGKGADVNAQASNQDSLFYMPAPAGKPNWSDCTSRTEPVLMSSTGTTAPPLFLPASGVTWKRSGFWSIPKAFRSIMSTAWDGPR